MNVETDTTNSNEVVNDPENTSVSGGEGQAAAGTADAQEGGESTPKTFTQEELDAIVAKRIARERKAFAREQQAAQTSAEITSTAEELNPDDFESPKEYAKAYAKQLAEGREAVGRQTEQFTAYEKVADVARDKYSDYDQVAHAPGLKVSEHMAQAIFLTGDNQAEVLYHLGKNPEEAARIAALNPTQQAMEIARLDGKLAGKTKEPTNISKAPPPINAASGRPSNGSRPFDPKDERFIKEMSTSDWIAAERKRQLAERQGK